MHVASQLDADLFEVRIDGAAATREQALAGWHQHDRFGIVVHQPFGALGASMLIQLAITAFYDIRPERRDALAHYPEIYLFHVGGPHGDHTTFDFWPPRKEVALEADPGAILDAINDRAITRLAVPDGEARPVDFHWKESETARDRIASAWAYSAAGRVADPDLAIVGSGGEPTEENGTYALAPARLVREAREWPVDPDTPVGRDGRRWLRQVESRAEEVPAATAKAIAARRELLRTEAGIEETYRRLPVTEALELLVP